MTQTESGHLIDILAQVPDPRNPKGKRHPLTQASAADLLTLRRGRWTIENKSHWVRDVVLAEDASQVRCGAIPQVMSALRNTAIAVLRFAGYHSVAQAVRYFAAHPQHALKPNQWYKD